MRYIVKNYIINCVTFNKSIKNLLTGIRMNDNINLLKTVCFRKTKKERETNENKRRKRNNACSVNNNKTRAYRLK